MFFKIAFIIKILLSTGMSLRYKINSIEENTCTTETCYAEAAVLKWSMDETADPCVDFYQYACGGYIAKTELPEGEEVASNFFALEDIVLHQLKNSFENSSKTAEPATIKKIRDFYKSCIDIEQLNSVGPKPLLNLFRKFGGWPVLEEDSWNEDVFDWFTAVLTMEKIGILNNPLFQTELVLDPDISRHRLIHLISVVMDGRHHSELLKGFKNDYVKSYWNLIVSTAIMLGASRVRARKELLMSLKFEIAVAQLIEEDEHHKMKTMTIYELEELTLDINWLEYFNSVYSTSFDVNYEIVVTAPHYLKELANLLRITPKRIISNYLMWRLTAYSSQYLGSRFRKLDAKLEGIEESSDRSDVCVDKVLELLPIATASLYVRDHADPKAKTVVGEMFENIRKEFESIIKEAPWMNDNTRYRALEKLWTICKHIAYPKELLNDKQLDSVFEDLSVNEDDYFSNIISASKFHTLKKRNSIHKTYDRKNLEWHEQQHAKAADANGYYKTWLNSIYLPAGYIQSVMFNLNRPSYLNYGALGWIIGHELTHGFDYSGRHYDKNGNYVNWWDKITDEKYERRANCLRKQYANFTLPETGMKGDGERTLNENIADNGGLKQSYRAYQTWVRLNGAEPLLPNISLNQNQLFWLSAANIWCEKATTVRLQEVTTTDEHGPTRFRVNGPMMNTPTFARDYHCKLGTPMNPRRRCAVW